MIFVVLRDLSVERTVELDEVSVELAAVDAKDEAESEKQDLHVQVESQKHMEQDEISVSKDLE